MNQRRLVKLSLTCACLALILCFPQGQAASFQSAAEATARTAVELLRGQCLACHGPQRMSGLDLRTRAGLLQGGTRGAAVVPGKSAESLLYQMIAGTAQPRMPLGATLTVEQIALLKIWIEQGASWPVEQAGLPAQSSNSPPPTPKYWAFRPPLRAAAPPVKLAAWVRNPIDAFVLAKLEEKGLRPAPPADKTTWLRRVTFDLTGLPPTPAEIKAFVADLAPEADERVVNRLLASPRYGERWAQHWLDVARFGETNGYELDADREQAWRYRDWVVRALNEDKPFDRFLREQIAGDELAAARNDEAAFELRVAGGFLRGGPQHVVAGNQDEAVNRQEWLTEIMHGIGGGVLGLTVGCARCHDHKFDPIPQADFYRLQAFFAATDNHDYARPMPAEQAAYEVAAKAHKEKLKPLKEQLKQIEQPYEKQIAAQKRAALEPRYRAALDTPKEQRTKPQQEEAKHAERMLEVKYEELLAALPADVRARRAALRWQMHRLELDAPEPLPTALTIADKLTPTPAMHIFKGGDPHRPANEVQPRFPSVLLPPDAPPVAALTAIETRAAAGEEFKSTGRRTALAQWLTQPDHPLTARVMMNRLWHYHFGRGIVATPNDFGRNGQPPTHPELLDWLATEFTAQGWSLKRMHALLVLSHTYRQSSAGDAAQAAIDPDNQLLWRMKRQRLEAEALRDAVLAAAGTLTEQLGGPSIRVPLEPEVYDTIFTEHEPDNLWPVHPDPRQHTRRSLYLLRKRNVRLPLLVAFDAPDLMSSCGARSVSVHALQALTLLNSDFMHQQSRALAGRIFRAAAGREREMIGHLYELTLGRPPRPLELRAAQGFLARQRTLIKQRRARGEAVAVPLNAGVNADAANAAAWVDLCLATLNLNEFVYVN